MTVTVHVGLPCAQDETLRKLFLNTPELTVLGRGVNEALDAANTVLARPGDWDPGLVKPAFDAALAEKPGPAVLSGSYLTSWRAHSPRYWGGQIGQVLEKPKLLLITRQAVPWAWDYYFSRLKIGRPDTYAGPSAWAEKHLSQFRIGSELAQVQVTRTLEQLSRGCDATEIMVLPAEMLDVDRQGFLGHIDEFIGAGGAIARQAETLEIVPDNNVDLRLADAMRVFRLYRREREQFLEIMDVYGKLAPKAAKPRFQELRADPDTTQEQWAAWFTQIRFRMRKMVSNGNAQLLDAVPECGDYELRAGLAAYLKEIEAQEADLLMENFGLDLRAYGYAAEAPQTA